MLRYWWLVAVVVLVLIEMITRGLTTIWFACGALLAFFASLLGADEIGQFLVFVIASLIFLFLTRPLARRYLYTSKTRTNVQALIGQTARVTQRIDNFNGTGTAIADGKEWTARSKSGAVIEADAMVTILEIQGVKLIVEETGRNQGQEDTCHVQSDHSDSRGQGASI